MTKYWAFARGGAWRNPKPTGGPYICKQCRLDACGGNDAEVERGLISERTKEGLASAKAKGKLLGRPNGALGKSKLDGKEQDIRALLGKGAFKLVGRSALYHFIETRKIAPG